MQLRCEKQTLKAVKISACTVQDNVSGLENKTMNYMAAQSISIVMARPKSLNKCE